MQCLHFISSIIDQGFLPSLTQLKILQYNKRKIIGFLKTVPRFYLNCTLYLNIFSFEYLLCFLVESRLFK